MFFRGVRGATTAEANTPEAIRLATRELLLRIMEDNDFQVEDDPGFGFDDYGDSIGRLTLNYIADLIDDCDVFFPGFSSAVDESRKTRGFVMLTRNCEISSKMRECPFLREYEK